MNHFDLIKSIIKTMLSPSISTTQQKYSWSLMMLHQKDSKEKMPSADQDHLDYNLKIGRYTGEIADIISDIDALQYEMEKINKDELVVYKSVRGGKSSIEGIAIVGGGNGSGLGLIAGIASGSLLTMGAFVLGGAALGVGAIALNAYIKNNWSAPVVIEYKGIPFTEAKPFYTGGKLAVIESKPEEGIYRALFYPEVFSNAEVQVDILVKKKQLPQHSERIQEITKEIERHQQTLKIKQEELENLIQTKNKFVEEKVSRESALKCKRLGFFQPHEDKALRRNKAKIIPLQKLRRIVLDIDDMLATPLEHPDRNWPFLAWFRDKQLSVWAVGYEHILHPGVVEFIRYLCRLTEIFPGLELCVFSSGIFERNRDFVRELFERALGKEGYAKYIATHGAILIKSKDDLDKVSGGYRKNLLETVQSLEELKSTLLIDNSRMNLHHTQLPNGLITQYADEQIFDGVFSEENDHDLQSANQIFWVVGLLKELFALESGSPTRYLFNLQYYNKGNDKDWIYRYGIALLSLSKLSDVDFSLLENECIKQNAVIALVKMADQVFAFGKPDGTRWELTLLDDKSILEKEGWRFPKDGQESIVYHSPWISFSHDDPFLQNLDKSMKAHNAHTEFNYEVNFDLYKDKSLYLDGWKVLKEFDTDNHLQLFGHGADEYFGLKPSLIPAEEPEPEQMESIVIQQNPLMSIM